MKEKGEMNMERCGNCKFKRKVRSTTFYECLKYSEILPNNPAQKCKKCLENSKPKQTKSKKDYIEVK